MSRLTLTFKNLVNAAYAAEARASFYHLEFLNKTRHFSLMCIETFSYSFKIWSFWTKPRYFSPITPFKKLKSLTNACWRLTLSLTWGEHIKKLIEGIKDFFYILVVVPSTAEKMSSLQMCRWDRQFCFYVKKLFVSEKT